VPNGAKALIMLSIQYKKQIETIGSKKSPNRANFITTPLPLNMR
jgi:hypothetical protein